MTSAELIRAVGEALWSERHWRAEMASALGVGDRVLRRWATGEVEPPPGIWRELLEAIDARRAQLTSAMSSPATRASATPGNRRPPVTRPEMTDQIA